MEFLLELVDRMAITKNKVAVVTGSTKGIGKAIAVAFAKSRDYSGIVVNGRNLEEALAASEEIKALGCNSISIQADISKEVDCVRLIAGAAHHFGRIDVLVNNAGIQKEIPFAETTFDEWYKILAVDLTGPFICSREAVRYMQGQDPRGGVIINVSSVHQTIPKPHYVPYSTSKAGIEMMSKTMALELARDNIRVNVVAPGATATEMNKELEENPQELQRVLNQIPLGRIGMPEDVANVVEFLASDKATYITGASFFVDGGMTLYPSFGSTFQSKESHAA